MEKTNKNGRLQWIDYARGIAIILVVYRHIFEGLKRTKSIADAGINIDSYLYLEQANIFFFSFRMPLFFIVSGIFINSSLTKRGLKTLVENKAKTILYPYFLWGCLQITIQIIFSSYINSPRNAGFYAYLLYQPREIEQFWYLYALFNVTILYALLKSQTAFTSFQHIGIGLFLFMISELLSQYKIELGFISDIFHYYVFLALGSTLDKQMIYGSLRNFFYSWKSFFILLIPFAIAQYYFLTVNIMHKASSPKYLYVEYYQPVMYLLIALTGGAFIISVSSLLERYNVLKWLRYTGKHSLYIYVMHVIVFAAVRITLTKFMHIYNIPVLLFTCIFFAVLLPILFYQLTEKLGIPYLFSLEKSTTITPKANKIIVTKPKEQL